MTTWQHSTDHTDPLSDLLRRVEQAVPPPSEADVQRELDRLTAWMNEPTQHAATPPPADDAPFLTVAEAAVVMQVTKMTVYRLVHAGDLPSIRTGRSFRIPSQALLDYLNAPGITRARA